MADNTPTLTPSMGSRLGAEAVGTFLLSFGVVGTALYAAGFNGGEGGLNVGFLGVALALGLTVVVGAYAFGPVSGGHFNPAVTFGLAVARRFSWKDVIPYLIAQFVGAAIAGALLLAILAGNGSKDLTAQFQAVSTGFENLSPGGYSMGSMLLIEVITTAVFVWVILGVTHSRADNGFAPLAIGLTLTLMALIAIPVSNASFNPARSLASALYGGPDALAQLWASFAAPILGGILAGATFHGIFNGVKKTTD